MNANQWLWEINQTDDNEHYHFIFVDEHHSIVDHQGIVLLLRVSLMR